MAWLHTWAGLVVSWLLLTIFISGTATYYRSEITTWMHPEIRASGPVSEVQAVDGALRWLHVNAPTADGWQIDLPSERLPVTQVAWQGDGRFDSALLDPVQGQALSARPTQGGDFFYAFHFQLNLPPLIGRWIVGVAAMIMFMAIISGVIIHRRIFKDFFTLRPGKGQRSWLDAHNSLSVLALPFHLLITYTGLVTLMFLYFPAASDALYRDDSAALYRDTLDYVAPPPRSGASAPMASAAMLVEQARQQWGSGHLQRLELASPGTANARLQLVRDTDDQLSSRPRRLTVDAADATLIEEAAPSGPARKVYSLLYGLHMAHFADPLLRGLLFFSGLGGCLMIATGMQLWVIKRRTGTWAWLHRRLEGLNAGVMLGLPLAMAGYFWANRLIPADAPGRDGLEVNAFFGVWLVAALYGQCRAMGQMWKELTALCALGFLALPLLDTLTRPGVFSDPAASRALASGFNLTMALLGVLFASGLWHLRRRQSAPPRAIRNKARTTC
nr:PepSY-associated TM helix domain-containing protein [Pseudomonas sp. dw_358]